MVIKPNCVFNYSKGFIRFNYDRKTDYVYITPCCNAKPINFIEPIAWKSEYFINNFEECLNKYHKADLSDLNKYYYGQCLRGSRLDSKIQKLCNFYTWNTTTTIIENSIQRSCNLNCIMCGLKLAYNNKEIEISRKIYDKLASINLDTLLTTTAGEPFLDKNYLLNFLKLNNNNYNSIYITTNASLLNDEDIIKLAKYKNIKVAVSFDSIFEKTYETIRLGSNYYKVLRNIQMLNKYNLLSHINYVVQSDNLGEYKQVPLFFDNLSIKVDYLINADELNNNEVKYATEYLRNTESYLYKSKSISF